MVAQYGVLDSEEDAKGISMGVRTEVRTGDWLYVGGC